MIKKKVLISIISLFSTIVILEIVLHLLVIPSDRSYGNLFGTELPPRYIIPASGIEKALKRFNGGSAKSDGHHSSVQREDPILGYTNRENATSDDGLFRSNNLGAKSDEYTRPEKTPGRERILFFGDSFTEGVGLPPEKTFVYYINQKDKNVEALNFGVGGYGTGQAYLRFKSLKNKLEFDSVVLVFVPNAELWRDINVSRYIGEFWTGWELMMNPRFVINGDKLELVTSPYKSIRELLYDNKDSISPRLKNYLKKYDAFYYGCLYDSLPSLLDYSIIYKLLKLKYCPHFVINIREKYKLYTPKSEAMKITKMIIEEMGKEVESKGANFAVVILPVGSEISKYRTNASNYKKLWDTMSSFICSVKFPCYDLMADFQKIPYDSVDYSDGYHYGSTANKYIAEFILNRAIENTGTSKASEN